MDFVKKNIVLVVVLVLTGLVSAYLIFMDVGKHSEVIKANRDVESLKDQIAELNKKKPAPLAANLDMIKKDTAVLKEKAQELQRKFGKPFRAALIKFAEALDLSEGEVIAKYKEYCQKNSSVNDKYAIIDGFVKSLGEDKGAAPADKAAAAPADKPAAEKAPSADKGAAAVQAFRKAAQEHMIEPVTDQNYKDFLLQAFGVPRVMSPTICKDYIFKMQELFYLNYKPLVTSENVAKLTFDYNTRVPPAEEVQAIIRHLQLFDDLFWRMRAADLAQVVSLERLNLNGIHGDEVSKDFLKFSYRTRVAAEMSRIREFINLLQDSYKDNRIYAVKDISLQSVVDETTKINDKSKDAAPRIVTSVRKPFSPDAKGDQAAEELPPEARPDYGKPVIGESKLVQADIEFDYYIYVGDELKR